MVKYSWWWKLTIYDIAKLAGVSKSTVSRIINNDKSVSKQTREKVEKIMREQNFVPNNSAILLNKKRKKKLMVLMTRLDSYSENQVLHGLIDQAKNIEFQIFETEFSIEKTKEIILDAKGVDGIIIFAISNFDYKFINELFIPVCFIGQKIPNQKCIYFSDYNGMRSLIEVIKPSNNVLYVGVEADDKTSGYFRFKAVLDYCQEHEIDFDYRFTSFGASHTFNELKSTDLTKYDYIFCATDLIALGVSKLTKDDVILCGFGNNQKINFLIDNFTTVDLNYRLGGQKVLELLFTDSSNQVRKNNDNSSRHFLEENALKMDYSIVSINH
ncbi:MAG: LacI family DNA-binding transcriptional regulator [Mycoplasmatales bacterium]